MQYMWLMAILAEHQVTFAALLLKDYISLWFEEVVQGGTVFLSFAEF